VTAVRINAPAKINWTLEVLGKRSGGYHEIRSVMQTIDLCDKLTLSIADDLSLELGGETGALADEAAEANLAIRAARLLRERTGCTAGARIALTKGIPTAAGLGGGSSNAAATLRGLRKLWALDVSDEDLAALGAELGSDVPFFIHGGAELVSGRGEIIKPLPDGAKREVIVAWPKGSRSSKTARMYAALGPERYTDGWRTERLAERVRRGEPVRDEDLFNVFERVLPEVDREAAALFEETASLGLGRPYLCGSGPAFFLLVDSPEQAPAMAVAVERLAVTAVATRTLASVDALVIHESA
jgi:4-diphosphocytidyl-2-C-methyl-D-erythritol kinase